MGRLVLQSAVTDY